MSYNSKNIRALREIFEYASRSIHSEVVRQNFLVLVAIIKKDIGRGRPPILREISFKLRHENYGIRARFINYAKN